MSDFLIEPDVLRQTLAAPDRLVFDVRYSLTDPQAGEMAYLSGHIPGAHFLNQSTQLASPSTGRNGRHPLPDQEQLAQVLQRAGLHRHSQVVVYDQSDGSFAARAWWLLRWLGHSNVAVLNGGWQAWLDAGGTQQSSVTQVRSQPVGTSTVTSAVMPTMDTTAILTRESDSNIILLDARTPERYRGEIEPIDPVAGRIHGALNRPVAHNVQPDGRFKDSEQLRKEFTALLGDTNAQQVVHYCGSGIHACHNIFAMEMAGLSGSVLYPGSWSEWCSDTHRPVETG